MAQNLSKDTSEQLQSYLQKNNRDRHTRSASLSGPMATSNRAPISRRPRSRSATYTGGGSDHSSFFPAPVKVSVTRERIRESERRSGSTQQQVRAKLKYTSHWGSQHDEMAHFHA